MLAKSSIKNRTIVIVLYACMDFDSPDIMRNREENNIVPTTMANTDSNMLSGVTITEIGISNENPSMIREPTSAKIMETVIIPRR